MQDETGAVETRVMDAIAAATDLSALEDVRVAALGKKGEVSALLKTLGGMDADDRQLGLFSISSKYASRKLCKAAVRRSKPRTCRGVWRRKPRYDPAGRHRSAI